MEKIKLNYTTVVGKNAKDIEWHTKRATQSYQTARNHAQLACVAILYKLSVCGDQPTANRQANVLIENLGNGINRNSMLEYFVRFGGMSVTEENLLEGWIDKQHVKDKFQDAMQIAWWSLKPPPAYKGFNLKAQLDKLYKQALAANKKQEDTINDKNVSEEDKAALLAKIEIDMGQLRMLNATVVNDPTMALELVAVS